MVCSHCPPQDKVQAPSLTDEVMVSPQPIDPQLFLASQRWLQSFKETWHHLKCKMHYLRSMALNSVLFHPWYASSVPSFCFHIDLSIYTAQNFLMFIDRRFCMCIFLVHSFNWKTLWKSIGKQDKVYILRSGKIHKHISMILLITGDCEVRLLVEKGRRLLYSKGLRKFLAGWKRTALVVRLRIE